MQPSSHPWRATCAILALSAFFADPPFVAPCARAALVSSFQRSPAKDQSSKIVGFVRDSAGKAIAGAKVWLEDASQKKLAETRSNPDGRYALPPADAGSYRLGASKNGYRPIEPYPIALGGEKIRVVDLTLQPESGANARSNPPDPAKPMELSDEPSFTVAGVTDWSNVGLHGSDSNVRTGETLAKETAALRSKAPEGNSAAAGAGNAHRLAGDAREKAADPVAAVREYAKAVELDPSEENYFAWGAELLLHRGGVATLEVFAKGSNAYPESARMLAGLGAAYYADGEFGKAAERFCAAAGIQPGLPSPYIFLGRMEKASAESFPCALERLARFSSDQPENALANYYYGVVLWKKARKSQNASDFRFAEVHLKKAVEIDPTQAEVYVQLGMLYNARGEKTAALENFEKAIAASPNLAEGHYHLSLAYRQAGSLDKAESEMKKYRELKKNDDAELVKQRKAAQQFVTILNGSKSSAPQ